MKAARDVWHQNVLDWRKEVLPLVFEMRQLQQYPHWMEMADWFKAEIGSRYVEQKTQQPWDHYNAKVYWSHRWEKNGPEVYERTWALGRRAWDLKSKREGLSNELGSFSGQDLKFMTCSNSNRPLAELTRSLEMGLSVDKIHRKLLEPEEMTIIDEFLQTTGFCPVGCAAVPTQR